MVDSIQGAQTKLQRAYEKRQTSERGHRATQAALRLQQSLIYVTVKSKRQGQTRRELKGPLNKHQQALLVELQALIADFVHSIILKYVGSTLTQDERDRLADYMMTEKVLVCLGYYRQPEEFTTYFGSAVHSEMVTWTKRRAETSGVEVAGLTDGEDDADSGFMLNLDQHNPDGLQPHSVEEEVVSNEYAALVMEIVHLLGPKDQLLLKKRFYYGLTFEEIAKERGVSRERARQLVNAALVKARNILRYINPEEANNIRTPHTEES